MNFNYCIVIDINKCPTTNDISPKVSSYVAMALGLVVRYNVGT